MRQQIRLCLAVICAVKAFFIHVVNRDMGEIVNNFEGFSRELTSNRQLCWIGPEKGTVHLAIPAVLKVLWAKQEGKVMPMGPQSKNVHDDIYRLRSMQEMIGQNKNCMLNAKQKREIKEAIHWVTEPAGFKPSCIKKPTFPNEDIHIQMGHATVSKPCHNRVIFKYLLQARAFSCLQIDSCRLGSVNESLSVLLMAKKFQRNALQNAAFGFGGLCQLVQNLITFNHIQVPERLENRYSCPG
ncbi:mitochondrial enolase superfamily member 1 [Melozone crissalis]|uniref:mitochondrial enolase superfamily member 1 n=1 Tax=Melozone crissalis TaxID=40204 RepID=UPI0023DA2B1C|nr:mitochondrial enolase superfamily member 1 [Melozone crissalis]